MHASFAIAQGQGQRKRQEDYAAYEPSSSTGLKGAPDLVVLADGMGGHAGGDTASRTAVETVLSVWRSTADQSDHRARLRLGLNSANAALDRAISDEPALEGMGCTLVALRPSPEGLFWLSVGDSPLWRVRGRDITRLNADHSRGRVLDSMAEAGLMTAEEARSDRGRNQLQHALAGEPILAIDEPWVLEPLKAGDVVVLASDGLDVLSPHEIAEICARGKEAQDLAQALLDAVLAKAAPNQDNVTIAVLKTGGVDASPAGSGRSSILPGALAVISAALAAVIAVVLGPRVFPPPKPPPATVVAPESPSLKKPEPKKPAPQIQKKPKPEKPKAAPSVKTEPEPKPKPQLKPQPKPRPKPKLTPSVEPGAEPKPKPAPKPLDQGKSDEDQPL